jgi:outer membrane protein assembly factor BamB
MRRLAGKPVGSVSVAQGRIAVALSRGRLELLDREHPRGAVVSLGAAPSAAPVLLPGQRVLIPLATGVVVCVDGDRVAWRTRLGRGKLAPLAVAGDGTFMAGGADGRLTRLAPDGTIVWQRDVGGPVARSPVIDADGGVVVAAGKALLSLDAEGGLRWRTRLSAPVAAGPLLAEGGTVYVAVGGRRARVLAVDGSGRSETELALGAPPTRGLSLADGVLWVGLSDRTLRRVHVTPGDLLDAGWAKARGDRANTGAAALAADARAAVD